MSPVMQGSAVEERLGSHVSIRVEVISPTSAARSDWM